MTADHPPEPVDVLVDVLVVGGGSAGLAAALTLARARRTVTVVDAGAPRNQPAAHVHGYLSRDTTPPAELLAAGAAEVSSYGAELVTDHVTRVTERGDGRFLVTTDQRRWVARSVIVATGLRDDLPDLPGLRERWGTTVLHCPYCHGWEVRDSPVAVLGGDNPAFTRHQVQLVRQWTDDVVYLPGPLAVDDAERERLDARGIGVLDSPVIALVDVPGHAVGVQLADGHVLPLAAVFVGPRFVPHDDLLTELGCARDDHGALVLDPTGHTSVAGAWAAGNVARDTQAIVSAASGVTAAIAANHHLLADDIDRALTAHRIVRTTVDR